MTSVYIHKISIIVLTYLFIAIPTYGTELHLPTPTSHYSVGTKAIQYASCIEVFAKCAKKRPLGIPQTKNPSNYLELPGSSNKLAQEEGFEPPTSRLTAGCSTTELLLNFYLKVNYTVID